MNAKGKFLVAGVAAGTLFGIGLAIGMLIGARWRRLTGGLRARGLAGRRHVRYGALQQ